MIIAELTLPSEPDVAWRHLREPELIRRWFGWDYDGLGHEIDVIFLQEVAVDDRARVLDFGDGIQDGDEEETRKGRSGGGSGGRGDDGGGGSGGGRGGLPESGGTF